jgi:hypothetical protein
MLSLLKSLGMLWPWKGPPAGSAKQPTEVNPMYADTVRVPLLLDEVVVTRAVVGALVVEMEVGEGVLDTVDDDFVDDTVLEDEIDEDTLETELDTELEDDDEEPALRLLYIESREEPPQYSSEFPLQTRLQVFPVVARTLPAPSVFPQ